MALHVSSAHRRRTILGAAAVLTAILAADVAGLAWLLRDRTPLVDSEATAAEVIGKYYDEEDPFRVVGATPAGDVYCLELDFHVSDVDFTTRLTGAVEGFLPIDVVAEGQGATAEEAIADALREAVRQVLTQSVDVGNLLEHRARVDRDVLAKSPELVLQHTLLTSFEQDDRSHARLCASVNRAELISRLRQASIPLRDADQ